MRIIDRINPGEPFISLEFFPPKDQGEWPVFFRTVKRLAEVDPLFVSVTYGAGGSTYRDTLEIVTRLKRDYCLEAMAHLTCIGSSCEDIRHFLDNLSDAGVDNVLALRGDLPGDDGAECFGCGTLHHASDLVAFVRSYLPGLGIGVAGYPETHPEAVNPEADLAFLKLKLDQGADFVVTQLFFENSIYYDFVRRARAYGIDAPIIPGILPVVSLKVINRIVSLCGATIPPGYLAELEDADRSGGSAAVQDLGVAYARRQAKELLDSGVPGIHLYTLNRAEAVLELVDGLLH